MDSNSLDTINVSVYLRLALVKKIPLLPSLYQLTSPVTTLLPYFAKSLAIANVHFLRPLHNEDRTFLCALTENTPMLQSLTLSGDISTGALATIAACNSLRVVDIRKLEVPLNQASFDALLSLPKLGKLTIDLPDDGLELLPRSETSPFAELQTLVATGHLPPLTAFLTFIGSSPLKILSVKTYTQLVPDEWRKCILPTAPYASSIRSIEFLAGFQASQMSIMGASTGPERH
jgi:hypothetical protein